VQLAGIETREERPAAAPREAAPAAPTHTFAGIGLMLLGILMFAVNDTLGKWLVGTFSVGQILLFRSAASLVVLAPLIWRAGPIKLVRVPRPGLQVVRVVLATLEVAFFYWSVALLPLADAMTYYLAGPIYLVALSRFILGERTSRARWLAVLAGFAGVVVALGPSGDEVSWGHALAIAGSVLFAFLMIVTRVLAATPGLVLVTWQTVGAMIMGVALAPTGCAPVGAFDMALLALLGVISLGAHLAVARSLRLAPASVVVPFQYTMIVWAVVFGYAAFGDVPGTPVMAGAAVIVVSGVAMLVQERREGNRR
jgi:drug/metabolite transporter (DMT)-like permease